MIPENIAENGVVVASSNNGAVQNIVNELPLIEGQIDEKFADEVKNADYFSKLANSKVTAKWEKDENGKNTCSIISSLTRAKISSGVFFARGRKVRQYGEHFSKYKLRL